MGLYQDREPSVQDFMNERGRIAFKWVAGGCIVEASAAIATKVFGLPEISGHALGAAIAVADVIGLYRSLSLHDKKDSELRSQRVYRLLRANQ